MVRVHLSKHIEKTRHSERSEESPGRVGCRRAKECEPAGKQEIED